MEKKKDKEVESTFGPAHAYRPRPKIVDTISNEPKFTFWFSDTTPPIGLDLMSDGSVRWRTDT